MGKAILPGVDSSVATEEGDSSSAADGNDSSSAAEGNDSSSAADGNGDESSSNVVTAQLLEAETWIPISTCTSRACQIPLEASNSRIRVIVTGNDDTIIGTANFTSTETIKPADSQDETSSSEEIVPPSSEEVVPPSSEEPSKPEDNPNYCRELDTNCAKCDDKDTSLCILCNDNFQFNDNKLCVAIPGKNYRELDINCISCYVNNPSVCARCDYGYELKNGKCELTECIPELSNCTKCANNRSICTECEDQFALRNGRCEFCENGRLDEKQCNPMCNSITNCKTCSYINYQIVCNGCQENYTLDYDLNMCVEEICTHLDGFCVECDPQNPRVCTKCNENEHFVLNAEKKCVCAEGYTFSDRAYTCLSPEQQACYENDELCYVCASAEKCERCEEGYILEDGICKMADCSSIEHCSICFAYRGETLCDACDSNELKVTNGGKKCEKPDNGTCADGMNGCLTCWNYNPYKCRYCDESKDFELPEYSYYCRCKNNYDFVNGRCLEPLPVISRPDDGLEDEKIEKNI